MDEIRFIFRLRMNLVLIFTIISFGVTLSETNEQGSKCEVSSGVPIIVNRDLGTFGSRKDCAQACKSRQGCLVWKYNRKSDECSIVKLKVNDDKQFSFGITSCTDSPPTTISGLENVLDEMRNMSKAIEVLKEQNENGFNNMNEKLTNVESQNQNGFKSLNEKLTNVESQYEVLQLDYKEQTNLTMEKIVSAHNDLKNDSQVLHQQLTSLNEQTNLTKMEIKEKMDIKFDVAYNEHEMLKNESQVLGNELKSLIVDAACPPVTTSLSTTTSPPVPTCPPVITSPPITTCPPAPTCPPVTTVPTTLPVYCSNVDVNTGTCYKYKVLTDKTRSWNDSRAECQRAGGDLAKIETNEEWQFVKKDNILSGLTLPVWLGGTDQQQEGSWLWTDGSPVSFTDWIPGSPENNPDRNCLMAHHGHGWQFYDWFCDIPHYYALCKIQANFC